MKANKTLKRLSKIEALLSDIGGRQSAKASNLQQALLDAGAAITRAKEIVNSQAAVKTERKARKAARPKKKAAAKKTISAPARKTAPRTKATRPKAAMMTASSAPIVPAAAATAANIGEVD